MNALKNHVQLIGRIGAETELKTTDNGAKFVSLSLATNESFKDKDGKKQEKTYWHKVIAWGKTAEHISTFCKKGDELAVEGKLTYRSYEKDGETRYLTEIVVNEFLLMGGKS